MSRFTTATSNLNFSQTRLLDFEAVNATSTKYSRLPNGMIINHDVTELKR